MIVPTLAPEVLIALTQTNSMSLTLSLLLENEGIDLIQTIADFLHLEATSAQELIKDWNRVHCIGSSLTQKSIRQRENILGFHSQLGLLEGIKWLKDRGIFDANLVLRIAAGHQHFDIVDWARQNGATNYTPQVLTEKWNLDSTLDPSITDPNIIICYAALKGRTEDVKALLPISTDYDLALKYASKGGHVEIVRLLLKQPGITHFDEPLQIAAQLGHLEIAHLLIDYIEAAQIPDFDLNSTIVYALAYNQIEFVKSLIDRGVLIPNFNVIAACACGSGHLEILQIAFDHLDREHVDITYNILVSRAASSGHLELVKMIIDHANAVNYQIDYPVIFMATGQAMGRLIGVTQLNQTMENVVAVTKFLYEKLNPEFRLHHVNETMVQSGLSGRIEIVQLMMQYASDDPNPIATYNRVLMNACYMGHIETVRLMLKGGPLGVAANDYVNGLMSAIRGRFKIKIIRLMLELDWVRRHEDSNYVGINYENMIEMATQLSDHGVVIALSDRSEVLYLLREYQQRLVTE